MNMNMNTNTIRMRSARGFFSCVPASLLLALSLTFGHALAHAAALPQSFDTPEAAVDALIAAARAQDEAALLAVLGDRAAPLVSSGDEVADRAGRDRFVAAWDTAHALVADGDERLTLEVGEDAWPSPVQVVKVDGRWRFDSDAGIDEMVYRRVGRNELGAIDACRGLVEAQIEYASEGRDGLPAGIYAQKLVSDPGKHNGLYWPSAPDERASPVGPFIARAAVEGYRSGDKDDGAGSPAPYHGYVYRSLNAQGDAANGGARSYIEDGQMKGGFAVIAYPVEYESSGVETFIVSQDGVVYQKDLGAETGSIAQGIQRFDPDASWSKVE